MCPANDIAVIAAAVPASFAPVEKLAVVGELGFALPELEVTFPAPVTAPAEVPKPIAVLNPYKALPRASGTLNVDEPSPQIGRAHV